jgi:hypothetical protein
MGGAVDEADEHVTLAEGGLLKAGSQAEGTRIDDGELEQRSADPQGAPGPREPPGADVPAAGVGPCQNTQQRVERGGPGGSGQQHGKAGGQHAQPLADQPDDRGPAEGGHQGRPHEATREESQADSHFQGASGAVPPGPVGHEGIDPGVDGPVLPGRGPHDRLGEVTEGVAVGEVRRFELEEAVEQPEKPEGYLQPSPRQQPVGAERRGCSP